MEPFDYNVGRNRRIGASGDSPGQYHRNPASHGLSVSAGSLDQHGGVGDRGPCKEPILHFLDSVEISKRKGKLKINFPAGTSSRVAKELGNIIEGSLAKRDQLKGRKRSTLLRSRPSVSSYTKVKGKGSSRLSYCIQDDPFSDAEFQAKQALRRLVGQSRILGISELEGFESLIMRCPELATSLANGWLESESGKHCLDDEKVVEIIIESLKQQILLPARVFEDLAAILGDTARLHCVDTFLLGCLRGVLWGNVCGALNRGDDAFLHRLIPFAAKVCGLLAFDELVAFCYAFPEHAELPLALLTEDQKALLHSALLTKFVVDALESHRFADAGRLLIKAIKHGVELKITSAIETSAYNLGIEPSAVAQLSVASLIILLLCRDAEWDRILAWECAQAIFGSSAQFLLEEESQKDLESNRSVREWGERFLKLADIALRSNNLASASPMLEHAMVLSAHEKSLLPALENLAIRFADMPEANAIIRNKAKTCLTMENSKNFIDRLDSSVNWQLILEDAEAWFTERKLRTVGVPGQGFSFAPTDRDDPSGYESLGDGPMAIKLATGWALNPDASLTRACEILSFVMARAAADTEKSDEARRHAVALMRAITELVRAVRHSPLKEIQDRESDLMAFLKTSEDRAILFRRAYGDDLPEQRVVSAGRLPRSRDGSSSGTGRRW